MRMWTKLALQLIFAATLLAGLAPDADARRRGFFGGGGGSGGSGSGASEAIELVHDLPDTDRYLMEGGNYDLGWKYTTGSFADGVFVAYRGDQYSPLSDSALAALTSDLGFDPAARHRARVYAGAGPGTTADVIPRLPGESMDVYRDRARAMANRGSANASESPAAGPTVATVGAGGAAARDTDTLLNILLPLIGLAITVGPVWFAIRRARGRRERAMPDVTPELDTRTFDARIAARLQEINGGVPVKLAKAAATPVPAATPVAAPAAPQPRGFGRRGL